MKQDWHDDNCAVYGLNSKNIYEINKKEINIGHLLFKQGNYYENRHT